MSSRVPNVVMAGPAERPRPGHHPRVFLSLRKKGVDAWVERSALAIDDAGNAGGPGHDCNF